MPSRLEAAPRLAAMFALALVSFLTAVHAADNKPKAPGLGDPGRHTAIQIDSGRLKDGLVTIAGRDAGQQLIVTGLYGSGQTRTWTRKSTYEVSPAGIIQADANGLVTPIAEGEATVHISAAPGIDATLNVHVANLVHDLPINFPNQVTPLFTK